MFSSSFDFLPARDRKLSSYNSSRSKKRKANSDSELTLLDSFERHTSYQDMRSPLFLPNPLHEYEDIDIMGNSNDSNNLLDGNSVIDPSQMFINDNSTVQFSFSCNEIIDNEIAAKDFAPLDPTTEEIVDQANDDIQAMFPTSMFLNQESSDDFTFPQNETTAEHMNTDTDIVNMLNAETLKPTKAKRVKKRHRSQRAEQKPQKIKELKPNLTHMHSLPVENNSHINQLWLYDKEEQKANGKRWRNGPWQSSEEEILKQNIANYCQKNGVTDVKKLIFFSQKDERKEFYKTIAKHLNRPLFSIYRKVIRLYDQKNYVGLYSEKDKVKLQSCYSENQNWVQIGMEIGRSASSVKDKMRALKNKKKTGSWNEEELDALSKAVHGQTNTKKGENVTSNINWVKVSNDVGTRSEKQCRTQWLYHLNWKECGGCEWMKKDEIELIHKVVQSGATEEDEVDWKSIAQGWTCVRSPQWLRQKWWTIKKRYPKYQTCSFQELLIYLQTTYVENLLKFLAKQRQTELKDMEKSQMKQDDTTTSTGRQESQQPNQNLNTLINSNDGNRLFSSTNIPPVTSTTISTTPLQLLNLQIVSNFLQEKIHFVNKIQPIIQPTTNDNKFVFPNINTRELSSLPTNQPSITDSIKCTLPSFSQQFLSQSNHLLFDTSLKAFKINISKPTSNDTLNSFVDTTTTRQTLPSIQHLNNMKVTENPFSFLTNIANENLALPRISTLTRPHTRK